LVHRLVPGIALLLAYVVTPGAGEMTENLVHFLLDGHAAHAAHEAGEQSEEDAHGCSGPFQTCPCHGTSAFVADSPRLEVRAAVVEGQPLAWFVSDLGADGVLTNVFRPPIS
jgi:hypothetical protein